ncbi:hypothetical protein GCM10009839_53130 [Catenulispora yoronensis]|uniref:Uncharacterized protein n=1 Tax=Catenulispora yoronensis TaxID=450799 RepID=A0ABN2UUH5_9ACTN
MNGSPAGTATGVRGRQARLGTVSQSRSAQRAPGPGATVSNTRNAVRAVPSARNFLARTIVLFLPDGDDEDEDDMERTPC